MAAELIFKNMKTLLSRRADLSTLQRLQLGGKGGFLPKPCNGQVLTAGF